MVAESAPSGLKKEATVRLGEESGPWEGTSLPAWLAEVWSLVQRDWEEEGETAE